MNVSHTNCCCAIRVVLRLVTSQLRLTSESGGSLTPCEMSSCQRATRLDDTMRWLPLQEWDQAELELAIHKSLVEIASPWQQEEDEGAALKKAIAESLKNVAPPRIGGIRLVEARSSCH